MSTKSRWYNSLFHFIESTTRETVLPVAPVALYEDFLGSFLDVQTWTKRVTGAAPPTQLIKAVGNGALELLLTSAVEVQLSGVDWNDIRSLVLNQGLVFETKLRFTTLPAVASTAVVGLAGAHNAAIDTVAESIWFRWDFSGLITVEHDDAGGGHESSKVSTGVTLTTQWVILKIDCTNIADVRFYIDGQAVATGTTFNMSGVPALALQPVARLDKAAAAGNLGVMEIDYIRVWQKRS